MYVDSDKHVKDKELAVLVLPLGALAFLWRHNPGRLTPGKEPSVPIEWEAG